MSLQDFWINLGYLVDILKDESHNRKKMDEHLDTKPLLKDDE